MRVTNGAARHRSIKRVFKRAKGFRGGRRKLLYVAMEAVKRAEVQAFIGRKQKKREYRRLWITRINVASRAHGVTYSRLIAGLQKADIRLDRKQLSEIAINQPEVFTGIVSQAKAALSAK
jgi:large subunit ribosomal protein L20